MNKKIRLYYIVCLGLAIITILAIFEGVSIWKRIIKNETELNNSSPSAPATEIITLPPLTMVPASQVASLSPSPTPLPTTPTPIVTATPTPNPTPTATLVPTRKPTNKPTQKPSTPAPTANQNGELVHLGRFKLTAYCPCRKCSEQWGNKTATGVRAVEGRTIAVDPRVIPYGTIVVINGHEYVAEDCGGAIKNKRIDIYFESHKAASNFGVQYAEVYIKK